MLLTGTGDASLFTARKVQDPPLAFVSFGDASDDGRRRIESLCEKNIIGHVAG